MMVICNMIRLSFIPNDTSDEDWDRNTCMYLISPGEYEIKYTLNYPKKSDLMSIK